MRRPGETAAAAAALAIACHGAAAGDGGLHAAARAPVGVATFHDRSSSIGDRSACPINRCNAEITGGPRFALGWRPADSLFRFDVSAEFMARTDIEDLAFPTADGPDALFDVDVRTISGVAEAFRDFPLSDRWSAYVMAGAGLTYYQAENRLGSGDEAGLAPLGRLGAGFGRAFGERRRWTVEIGASATAVGSIDIGSAATVPGVGAEIGTTVFYEVLAGLRYAF